MDVRAVIQGKGQPKSLQHKISKQLGTMKTLKFHTQSPGTSADTGDQPFLAQQVIQKSQIGRISMGERAKHAGTASKALHYHKSSL